METTPWGLLWEEKKSREGQKGYLGRSPRLFWLVVVVVVIDVRTCGWVYGRAALGSGVSFFEAELALAHDADSLKYLTGAAAWINRRRKDNRDR